MTRINQINNSLNFTGTVYTKRTCSDNSEMYIASKLNTLYNEAVLKRDCYSSKRNLRKLVEGNHLDEMI